MLLCDIDVLMDIIDGRLRGMEYRMGVAISIGVSGSVKKGCSSASSDGRSNSV